MIINTFNLASILFFQLIYVNAQYLEYDFSFIWKDDSPITGVYPVSLSERAATYIISQLSGYVCLVGINDLNKGAQLYHSIKIAKSVASLRTFNNMFYALSESESSILELKVAGGIISLYRKVKIPSRPVCFHFIDSRLITGSDDGFYITNKDLSTIRRFNNRFSSVLESCNFRSISDSEILFFSENPRQAVKLTVNPLMIFQEIIFRNLSFSDIGTFPLNRTFALFDIKGKRMVIMDMEGKVIKSSPYQNYSNKMIIRKKTISQNNDLLIFSDGSNLFLFNSSLNHLENVDLKDDITFLLPTEADEILIGTQRGKFIVIRIPSLDSKTEQFHTSFQPNYGDAIVAGIGGCLFIFLCICYCRYKISKKSSSTKNVTVQGDAGGDPRSVGGGGCGGGCGGCSDCGGCGGCGGCG